MFLLLLVYSCTVIVTTLFESILARLLAVPWLLCSYIRVCCYPPQLIKAADLRYVASQL